MNHRKMSVEKLFRAILLTISIFATSCLCVPFIVQSLSSNYGLVLGGYGPGYEELREVEVVRHDKVCPDIVR